MAEKLVKNMAKFERLTQKDFQRGFSLIEVLVALVILVIGLIGIFNLHIVAKRGSFESFQQTQASYYIDDIINRMRLNRGQLANYVGTYKGNLTAPEKICDVGVGHDVNDVCSDVQTSASDLYQWEQLFLGASEQVGGHNVGGLDLPTACIKASLAGEVTVVMSWRGIRALSDGAAKANSFVQSCGTSSDRRRVLTITTIIL
ncbi:MULTISPECIES: type IV pilus modification protein PilV [Shewanella]|uniref:type IV pilus modification protein PilV n=1 Tax=Shewanella TaxID=22 RepID=UPI0018FF540B|nr:MULTISPECIES: type IV pilus modification protein PilV [Shewanella]MCI2962610.1 type IV pilus modification protein PilV [Shewanella sp. N2AIL]MDT3296202.1 type IV pilus modification protein PilV [Shewanella sp. SP2S2-6]MDT3337401.1 type IV pilus modification protein PilV [Shewanella sp. SP1S1-7]